MGLLKAEIPKLVVAVIICQMAGVAGSVFTDTSVGTWYPSLIKPAMTPPGYLIGIVWTALFTIMGVALFLVWRKGYESPPVRTALLAFAAQLIVNVMWSWAFFGLRSPLAGIVVIAVLWALIAYTIKRFWTVSREAALLLVPYILWVSFAAYLNYYLWRLNS